MKTTTSDLRNPLQTPQALLRLKVVEGIVGMSKSWIYEQIARGAFPEPIRLSVKCSRWRAADVAEWLSAQGNDK